MKRRSYGRDAGLTLRMLSTTALLGLLYVIFAVVLLQRPERRARADARDHHRRSRSSSTTPRTSSPSRASGAKIVSREEAPALHDMVERLCAMADLPKPKVAIMDTPVPNAFATGRSPKHAAVCVTTGLWERLEPKEVEGVLAHELSHIANRDVLIMTVASFFAMLAALLTRFGLYAGMFGGGGRAQQQRPAGLADRRSSSRSLTYVISFILIRTISRYREYAADRGSALITGAPEYLMSALQKISSQMTLIPNQDLRQVEGMSAFFIIPARAKRLGRRALHGSPAAREAHRGARRDRPRDGPPGRVATRVGLRDVLFGRKKLAEPKDDRLFALHDRGGHARDRARAEDGRRRRRSRSSRSRPASSGARSTTSTS